MTRLCVRLTAAVASVLAIAGCERKPQPPAAHAENADAFIERLNRELADLSKEQSSAGFAYATFINVDTEFLNAKANERVLEYFSGAVEKAKAYKPDQLSPNAARSVQLLKLGVAAPAPADATKRAELAAVTSKMEGMYGAAKYCPKGPESCKDQTELSDILANSRNYDELTEAWTGWHSTARPIRKDYVRFVELANEGAKELGFTDLGAMWRSNYDMPPDDFTKEAARLWEQVKPLYGSLHCYVRGKLQKTYGQEHVPSNKPIPAQLLGNMWAQQWGEIYPLVEPYPGATDVNVTAALVKQKYDPVKITQSAENFYVSLGFPKLPQTFWERSLLAKPRDRDVQCHASAWHMDGKEDVRIKQCIEPTQEHLMTVYHELGHVFYYLSYKDQPYLYQSGANDGFHEAIGDTVNLSMTPAYLHQIGLAGAVKPSKEATINQQMRLALDKLAFLPFGKLIDEWRWKVFSGEIKPENYNAAWWQLREQYQGVAAPVPRTEEDFDPGAKYHIPANTPYTRYFLSYILQFQFHRALCQAAGFQGPLNECSIYGNEEAGKRFREMLALGQSQPWQDTLEKLTGTREMDASAITEYFAPLLAWLEEQNKGQTCGW
ncbi:M2 family metallopeptidase [Steroidobacter agaridevorans]|uniref:M2 family metallopeptidase n=1 Tax=Steroidobacter agaridevorans TaxID=2695856 RepID=UPI001324D076|nr:M2 family metallopeptidase [Steroidobacter agaridevorans]GFE89712.1 peptidase M20 [Steroidobacter agaridevorans]